MSLINKSKSPRYSDFKLLYPKAKLEKNKFKLWRWLIIGRISLFVSWSAIRCNISANTITYLSFIAGLLSFVFFYPSELHNSFAGAILLNLSYLLDCSDGHIARYNKNNSSLGKFLDDSLGEFIITPMWFFIGFGLFNNSDIFIDYLTINIHSSASEIVLFLSFTASITYALRIIISNRYSENLLNNNFQLNQNKKPTISKIIYKNSLVLGGFLGPFLIIFSFLKITSFLIILYSFLYSFNLIYCFLMYYNKLNKQDNEVF